MDKPVIADNKPVKVTLEKDKRYHYCACGLSQKQPFCDGSHSGSSMCSEVFVAKADGDAYLCACKHTANAPYCDGSHKQFSSDQVGS